MKQVIFLCSLAVAFVLTACGGGGGSSTGSADQGASICTTPLVLQNGSCVLPTIPSPNITISLSKANVTIYQSTQISWTVDGATSCIGSGAWSGSRATSGTAFVSVTAAGERIFTLNCTGPDGTTSKSVTLYTSTPTNSFAGLWIPVNPSQITPAFNGDLANTFHAIIKSADTNRYGLVVTGWAWSGSPPSLNIPAQVSIAMFSSDITGMLKVNTSALIDDPVTNGSGSLIVTDFNGDGYPDIFLAAHNESPFTPMRSTAYFSAGPTAKFSKVTLSDSVMAHDATLAIIDGAPVVVAATFNSGEPIYSFKNGSFVESNPPKLSQLGGMDSALASFGSNGGLELVRGDVGYNWDFSTGFWGSMNIEVYGYGTGDVTSITAIQKITPYLSTLPQYKNFVSMFGPGVTHIYRLWAEDLNHDGAPDVLAGQSLYGNSNFPSALQILINRGDGTFKDMTDTLNSEMLLNTDELDYSPTFIDLDGSGINSLLFAGGSAPGDNSRQSSYLLLNDGTGKLYIALHDEFNQLALGVFSLLNSSGYSVGNYSRTSQAPKFIGIPQQNGSLNFIAETRVSAKSPNANFYQTAYAYVNVPLQYNPSTDFIRNITISDRNGSKLIRTWAGDDIITDVNASNASRIDGGLGKNTCAYSGNSSAYTVTRNVDGTTTVITAGGIGFPAVRDTLKNIQTIKFSDKTILLN